MAAQDAKIILYTNHRCPWAHRAHIALEELKVPYDEVIIDLSKPRTPEYLAINPRGLVPAISYNGEIIIESAIVANFLADQYPSHLLPPSNAPGGALQRARVALFVDAFVSKVWSKSVGLGTAKAEDEARVTDEAVAAIVKELEPLLADAKPFFGGSEKLTQAEVLTGSFAIRFQTLTEAGVLPKALWTKTSEQAPNFIKWVKAVSAHPSVTSIYDAETIISSTRARFEQAKAASA